jgi:predicted anti-sigma-YlaC factor YlaD
VAKRDCGREFEVLECAAAGVLGDDLRAHIAACECCRDLYDAAHVIVDDRAALMRHAHLPSAGLVFWRANMRAQREAARAAVRAGSAIQAVLLVTAIVAALAILGISIDVQSVTRSILASAHMFAIPLIALAAWLILAPVAVYFAVTDK